MPSSSNCGRLGGYQHDDSAFPVLGPVQAASSPEQAHIGGETTGLMEKTYAQVVTKLKQPSNPIAHHRFGQYAPTRKDSQFQQKFDMVDQALESYQYTGAQALLSFMDPTLRDQWLLRLHDALSKHVPMCTTSTTTSVIKKKPYYKRSFTPFFVEDAPPPLHQSTFVPKTPTFSFTPNTAKYNHWTDAAIDTYGDSSTTTTWPIQPKKYRTPRPSSTVKVVPPKHQDSIPTPPIYPSTQRQNTSRHVHQFSTYDGVHMAYRKYLLDPETTSGLAASTYSRPCESKSHCRRLQQRMRTQLDTLLRQYLQHHPMSDWTQLIDQIMVMVTLCDSMQPSSSAQQHSLQQTKSSSFESTEPQAKYSTIGTGIDHFRSTHRLQKRHRRQLRFEASITRQLSGSFAFYDIAPLYTAPSLRQHFARETSAPLLRQHILTYLSVHSSPQVVTHLPQSEIAPYFGQQHFSQDSVIAPIFWQHHPIPFCYTDYNLQFQPNSTLLYGTALHDDFSEHMGNSHFTDGGIFTPLFSSPHVLPFHNYDPSAPILQRHCSLTNPDGPGNILLFDEQNTRKRSKQEPLRPHIPVGLGNDKLLYPFAISMSCMDSQHMGKLLPVNLTNLTSTYFSPHAGPTFVHTPFANSFGQDVQKRPQQESNPQDRPNLLSFGPGDYSSHIDQKQPQYFPSGPGTTDYHEYQEVVTRAKRCIALPYLYWISEPPHGDPLISFSHGTFDSTSVFQCALTEPLRAVLRSAESSGWYNAMIWHEALFGTHTNTSLQLDPLARNRLVSRSKTSACGKPQDPMRVQRFPERDSSFSSPPLPSPSSSLYPPQFKSDLDPSPFHLTPSGISYSQVQVLLTLHKLTFCHLFRDCLDWLIQLVTPKETQGIFFHQSHWYAYSQDRHRVHVLLKNSNDPLCTFLMELTSLDSLFHTLSFYFYYAPPTPRGLCGLVAISSLCCLLGQQTQLPALQLSGYTLHWKHSKAIRELHTHYASIVASTSKHFSCGPIGFMDNANLDDSYNDPFTITDTMSPQVPSLHPDTFSIPLISPNFSHEPITYNLHFTDSELVDFLDIQTVVDQRFVYFHFDQSLSMSYFYLQETTTPPQLFSDKCNEFYPCYPQSCIKKILLWDNFLQTWNPTDFAQIDRLPQTNHLRIHFHTRWLHVDFPLIKRSFRIEITPVWTVQHVIDSLQTTLGHSSTSLILTQQGRTLPQYFDPWRALPSYTLKPLTAKIPPTLSIHQGRQLAKPLRYCTCNTLCATTHELTKRTITSFGNPQINVCIFRHPVNNNLFVLPICSITTPTHIHARFLPYNAVFWIPVVNDTFVSMDSILIHYGTPVALEFYELPLTRGIHTDTLYGTSLFHLRIQDPGTMTYRPYKRIILQPNPHLHRFVDIALIIEPTLTVEELELTLENFLRLNLDCLQPPRDQPVGTLVRNTVQQTYQVLVGEDPYAIRHNLYNPLFPKMATRPYPPNHDYWTISDQFCSFLQSVPKTSETTFRDVFYDHFRYDHFDYTSIRSIVFNNETWHLYDFVPITSCDRIVYVLSPIRLDLHLLEINTHVYLTVSPLTQISHLKQLLETYTHISKHHNILPYSDDDFVTILPQPTFIGFHPTDRSDSATLASQLTDLSTLTGSADPSLLALEDDPDPFLHIPFHYWVTDVDIDFVFSNLLQDDIHWFPPLSFRQGYAYLCSDSTFLTTFVFQSHWYACFFSAPDQEQRELDSHLLITRDSLPTAFLFVPPGFSSSQKHELLQNIATLLPICNIDYVYATLSLPGLCGITLIQCLFNWMSSHTSVPLPLRLRCLTYSNFDFTHLSLFFQSTELRRRHPLASQQFTFRAGAPSTDPNPTSNTVSDTTSPSPSTAAIPTLSGTTSYEVIQSCQDQEASHSLLSATQLAQFLRL